ncbi:hypothetical protein [Vibrio mangrovi]|uniref:Uncharacterized protein n=1 Tax=Vibrio mangrovi TaxID=474394 RepID=A0A1Y6IV35_9VIBR|nr:hypothetical protein [Vibrio mangrovi]MDW6003307.1 hypothetical protein [Vibrio mangrovi]SMR99903.1 hypothetical protein VIM7927_01139 [Vibrio mangrovi]
MEEKIPHEFELTQKAREYLIQLQDVYVNTDRKELRDVLLYLNNLLTNEVARLMHQE